MPSTVLARPAEFDAADVSIAFQSGDMRALQPLMTCFGRMMTCVARRYVRSPQDAEDAVQDAWLAFTRSAHAIENPKAVGGWLRVTTAHAALAYRAVSGTGRRRRTSGPTRTSRSPSPTRTTSAAARCRRCTTPWCGLDRQQRELVSLLFESDLSYVEIVARFGRTVGWIGPTRQRV